MMYVELHTNYVKGAFRFFSPVQPDTIPYNDLKQQHFRDLSNLPEL